ncbi:MAG: hypothetical protein ACKVOW_20460, partial [Chitinophagaceae bacterium]
QSLQFAFLLFYFSAFGGFLYVYYQPRFKRKILILSLFGVFIIAQSLVSGMFTIVAYMGITLFSFFFLGKKTSFIKKLSFFILGISLLFIIQSVKMSYRKEAWNKEFEGNRIELFGKLIKERFSSNDQTTLSDLFFPIYYRANQGFNIGLVMNRIPKYQDFDRGSNLGTIIISSFVPRVFWPNKPEAGGKGNMSHYTGYNIEGWSTNVGPLGEAYGSFGVNGGVIYMILLGAFIRWGYRKIFIFSQKLPLVLFWIPVVFYQVTYAAEADTLQVINSMVKSAFFVWIVYKLIPKWFGITKSAIEGPSKEHSATLISTHNT